jgi:hypothetical protein
MLLTGQLRPYAGPETLPDSGHSQPARGGSVHRKLARWINRAALPR